MGQGLALALLSVVASSSARLEDPVELRVGEVRHARLEGAEPPLAGHGPSRRFLAQPPAGKVTVALASLDFDAFVRVESEAGVLVAETSKGGIETDARLVLDAPAQARWVVVAACAEGPCAGEFELSLAAGEAPMPAGSERRAVAIEFRREARERARGRDDGKAELRHLHQLGWRLFEDGRPDEASATWEEVLALARERGDRAMEGLAEGSLGNRAMSTGRFEEARTRALRWVAIAEETGNDKDLVLALGDLSDAALQLGDPETARKSVERALVLARRLGDRRTLASALGSVGRTAWRLGELARARENFLEVRTIQAELGDRRGEGRVEAWLGAVCAALDQKEEAIAHLEAELAISRELGDKSGEAGALIDLAGLDQAQGRREQALTRLDAGLALAREIGHRQWELNALLCIGSVRLELGDAAGARRAYTDALAISRQTGDVTGEAAAICNLADAAMKQADLAGAREQYEAALAIGRRIQDRSLIRTCCYALGLVHMRTGRYGEARPRFEEALGLARELGQRAIEGTCLGDLGGLANQVGDYRTALRLLDEALAIAREVGDTSMESTTLGLQAISLHWLKDLPGARAKAVAGLEIARVAKLKVIEAGLLGTLGAVLSDLDDLEGARAAHQRDLELCRETGDRPGEAMALTDLATVLAKLERFAEARQFAREGLDLDRRIGEPENALFQRAILAHVALAEGDGEAAETEVREAARLIAGSALPPEDAQHSAGLRSRFAQWERLSQDTIALRLARPPADEAERARIVEEGFEQAGLWKGRALLEGIVEHRAGGRSSELVALRREREELRARRQTKLAEVSSSLRAARPAAEVEGLQAEAAALAAQVEKIGERLAAVAPRDARLEAPPAVTADAVRAAAVDARTVVIEYAIGAKRRYAYVLASGKPTVFVDLGPRTTIDPVLEEFLGGIDDPANLADAASVASAGHALHELLLAPALAAAGPDVERLVIVPTSGLATLPFEALVIAKPRADEPTFADVGFVIDRYEVAYVPSSAVLVEMASDAPRVRAPRLLVLADPVYASEAGGAGAVAEDSTRAAPLAAAFTRLPETRAEALRIAALALKRETAELEKLGRERSGSFASDSVDLHLGTAASPSRLEGDLKRYSILHFAAHGFVDPAEPRRSGIALASGPREGSYDGSGFVTIQRVLDLDLDSDLVVLSACETARGGIQEGEGVESLARAFLFAGSRGLVASTWPVDDRAAQETMEGFYTALLERGLPPARALREAKLAQRRASGSGAARGVSVFSKATSTSAAAGHPFLWAPFVYIGRAR